MGKKRHTPEEIVSKLRQVDVLVAQGTPVADAIRAIGVTEVTLGSSPIGANIIFGVRSQVAAVAVLAVSTARRQALDRGLGREGRPG